MQFARSLRRGLLLVIVLALLTLVSCGDAGDQDLTDAASDAADDSGAFGAPPESDLTSIVTAVAEGFGELGTSQRAAIDGVADGDAVCAGRPGPRARPAVSQIEVEVVRAQDGCLVFAYDVANFRTLVADIQQIRSQPDVVAASPMLLDYRLSQIESPWPIPSIRGSDFVASPSSPRGDGVTIAVIDSGIDTRALGLEDADIVRVPDTGSGDYTATGHGTIAAGIIVTPIGASSRGIAPNVTLLDVPADLCDQDTCGCDPCAAMTPAAAVHWAVENEADIISMSFGYVPADKPSWWQRLIDADELNSATETLSTSLAFAEARGIAMTAAAGNCAGDPNPRCEAVDQYEIPAGHDAVMAVGALEQDPDRGLVPAWYSTNQQYVELVAPGSLVVAGADGETYDKIGTSYANPFVAAAIAVLIGSDGPLADEPDRHLLAQQVLVEGARDLGPAGRDPASGFGVLQLETSLDLARQRATELAEARAQADNQAQTGRLGDP